MQLEDLVVIEQVGFTLQQRQKALVFVLSGSSGDHI